MVGHDDPDDPYPWDEPHRARGIFTESDREYLLGKTDLSGQDERNTRYRIRERITEALHDVALMTEEIEDRDLRQIVDNIDSQVVSISLLFLAYRILANTDHYMSENAITDFEYFAIEAIRGVEEDYAEDSEVIIDVDVDVEIERSEIDDNIEGIFEKMKELEATHEEFAYFVQNASEEMQKRVWTAEEAMGYKQPDGETVVVSGKMTDE